ncbi:collagenase-like protease [Vibrio albus]|uniref:Collagenase-like protease n=1 Tax=Vibrio albus TaxID=2200953 RepID=A0A2U3B8Z5_9VIBR|nr:peptidase U32 family protein [Vibrio albus]PWI33258.1 collagenase-like protease [Vibrio albus]
MDRKQFELLAPGGDVESIKAAIAAGADAIYCGLDRFNARNRATNLSMDNLKEILSLAHQNHCKIFVTLNIIILENEIRSVVKVLNQLANTDIDGVIIQDLGLGYILKHHFPTLDVHASTQMNTHNEGQVLLTRQLGASRVNLSRELNIREIKHLAQFGRERDVLMEVFIHGSYCIGFSGHCYISSVRNGASGNRGRCSQPCRDTYQATDMGVDHPLNMKDNCAFTDLDALVDAGVYSLKVEGRIKKPHYVYTVVDNWRKQIDHYCDTGELLTDTTELHTVFNRDFSTGYLNDSIGQEMMIDNPRDYSAAHFVKLEGADSQLDIQRIKQQVYDKKTDIIQVVNEKISELTASAEPETEESKRVPHKDLPKLVASEPVTESPTLSVLISSPEDIALTQNSQADIYYQLPSALARNLSALVELFNANPALLPWFPTILIGDDYAAAEQLLQQITPRQIVTNNTGVAYFAGQKNIPWVAGPELNITNSYALKCIKEEFGAVGAFISNEITALQMRRIVRPDNFRLYHSIYHPITLLTSRQCLFQQTTGCRKTRVNKGCLPNCEKATSIINLNGSEYVIHKQRGSYNRMYSSQNFLNTEVLSDIPGLYTDIFIDLRDIKTETRLGVNKKQVMEIFSDFLQGRDNAAAKVKSVISPTSNAQYIKGL